MSKKVQEEVNKKPLVDSVVYWVVQVAFAVAAVAGIKFYLQPIDPILANVFAVSLVGCLFYITSKLR
jgi:hypothetical protein